MSNQLENKQRTLAQLLAANRLTKIAGDQSIQHFKVKGHQDNLGQEQEQEAEKALGAASVQSGSAKTGEPVQTPPNDPAGIGCSFKNLSRTGTKVNVMDQKGNAAELPKQASADVYRRKLAGLVKMMDKKAAAQREENFTTASDVMDKIASLGSKPTDDQIADVQNELCKLASTNPLFNECRDRILMNKMAEDIMQLADAEGISPEEAADLMDAAVAQDPSIQEDVENEADAAAVQDLADAEEQGAAIANDVDQMAANASEVLGVEVSPDDIVDAIQQVEAQAEELGVPPEALIQAAAEELQAQGEVTPEDEEQAQAILDQAAEMGVSPDEVIEMASGMLADDGEGNAEAEEGGSQEGEEKQASYTPTSPRAAYVHQMLRR